MPTKEIKLEDVKIGDYIKVQFIQSLIHVQKKEFDSILPANVDKHRRVFEGVVEEIKVDALLFCGGSRLKKHSIEKIYDIKHNE